MQAAIHGELLGRRDRLLQQFLIGARYQSMHKDGESSGLIGFDYIFQ
jgi:hypothetical protein